MFYPACGLMLVSLYVGYRWGSAGVRRVKAELDSIEAEVEHDAAVVKTRTQWVISRLRAAL